MLNDVVCKYPCQSAFFTDFRNRRVTSENNVYIAVTKLFVIESLRPGYIIIIIVNTMFSLVANQPATWRLTR